MQPGKFNINVYAGGTYSNLLTAKNLTTDVEVDFTPYTSAVLEVRPPWHYKKEETRPAPLFIMELGTGISIDSSGVTIHLTATETEALDFTKGVYQLKLMKTEDTEDIVDIWFEGTFTVNRGL